MSVRRNELSINGSLILEALRKYARIYTSCLRSKNGGLLEYLRLMICYHRGFSIFVAAAGKKGTSFTDLSVIERWAES